MRRRSVGCVSSTGLKGINFGMDTTSLCGRSGRLGAFIWRLDLERLCDCDWTDVLESLSLFGEGDLDSPEEITRAAKDQTARALGLCYLSLVFLGYLFI